MEEQEQRIIPTALEAEVSHQELLRPLSHVQIEVRALVANDHHLHTSMPTRPDRKNRLLKVVIVACVLEVWYIGAILEICEGFQDRA